MQGGNLDIVKATAIQILDGHRLMAISTVRSDGWPQTTVVGYANIGTITEQIRKGAKADLSVTSPQQWASLRAEGKIMSDFKIQFAQVGLGIAAVARLVCLRESQVYVRNVCQWRWLH